jgi:hypothetical protein
MRGVFHFNHIVERFDILSVQREEDAVTGSL